MNDILSDIVRSKKLNLEKRKSITPLSELKKRIGLQARRDFKKALEPGRKVHIIAEIKRASPSAGLIREDFDPGLIAREYTDGGAAAISVLTEETYFKGDTAYLGLVRISSPLPVLCKDFVVDEYQIYEAAASGADAILLITAILDKTALKKLIKTAEFCGVCPLVEVHDKSEIQTALEAGAGVIGINNRNLKDLSVDPAAAAALIPEIPSDKLIVVESGIKTAQDIKIYLQKDVNSFLVGETLMRSKDIAKALKELING